MGPIGLMGAVGGEGMEDAAGVEEVAGAWGIWVKAVMSASTAVRR